MRIALFDKNGLPLPSIDVPYEVMEAAHLLERWARRTFPPDEAWSIYGIGDIQLALRAYRVTTQGHDHDQPIRRRDRQSAAPDPDGTAGAALRPDAVD